MDDTGPSELDVWITSGCVRRDPCSQFWELLRYTLNDDDPPEIIKIPAGTAYVSLIFNASFEVTGGAKFSFPNGLGVSADASAGRTFLFAIHRAFQQSTVTRDALQETLENIVFPFQAAGLDSLRDRDIVEWEFAGALHLGFGAQWGLDKLLVGGNSSNEVTESIGSDIGKLIVTAKPEISAGVQFGVTYDHTDKFRVLIQRSQTSVNNQLALLLFTLDKSDLGFSLKAGVTFDPGIRLDFSSSLDEMVKNQVFGGVPSFPGKDAAIKALTDKLDEADGQQEIKKLVSDTNNQLASFKQRVELDITSDRIHRDTALFRYHFDMNEPEALTKGYPLAMQGLWDQAILVNGVRLDPGVLIERDFIHQTSVSFQFFDLFKIQDTTQYFEQTKLIYVGDQNLRLQLEFDAGFKADDGHVGHAGHVEVYFTAVAPTNDLQRFQGMDVRLHVVLRDHANQKKALQTASVLANSRDTQLIQIASQLRRVASSDAALDVLVTSLFFPSAYKSLRVSEFVGNQPSAPPHTDDERNWDTFVSAVNTVLQSVGRDDQFPPKVANFDTFERLNIDLTDQVGGPGPANRRETGPPNAIPPSEIGPATTSLDVSQLVFWMEQGRHFLNLCDDLKHLATDIPVTASESEFLDLINELKGIAKEDTPNIWFTKPMLLSLIQLTQSSINVTKAPDPLVPVGDDFVLSFEVH